MEGPVAMLLLLRFEKPTPIPFPCFFWISLFFFFADLKAERRPFAEYDPLRVLHLPLTF